MRYGRTKRANEAGKRSGRLNMDWARSERRRTEGCVCSAANRGRGWRRSTIAVAIGLLVAAVSVFDADANPRDNTPRAAPARMAQAPASATPQTEPTDLDEGKTPQQIFASSCAVCHQSAQGLAKGRSGGQLGSFLRQHYTTSSNQARVVGAYVANLGAAPAARAPATARAAPAARPAAQEPAAARRPPTPEPAPAARRPAEPAVAATQPARRVRTEDGSMQPVEGLVVLPPGATELPGEGGKVDAGKPDAGKPDAGKPEPASREAKQAEPPARDRPAARPAEAGKPREPEKTAQAPAPAPAAEEPPVAALPRPPDLPLHPLTEDKPVPASVQEIPL